MSAPTHPSQPRTVSAREPVRLAFKMLATGLSVSFGALEARANQGAHVIRSHGVREGDHIAVLMENRREFLEICFAADRAGIYYTTISTHLSADEVDYIVRDCGAQLVIVSETYAPLVGDLPAGCQMLVLGTSWDEAAAAMPTTPVPDERQGLDMLYSSGTTGRPKGIKWPLTGDAPGGHTMLIDLLTSLFGYDYDTRYLCPAPLYHAAPLRHPMVTIKMGGAVFIMDKFDARGALQAIEVERITHSQWVPTMFVRMLRLPDDERAAFDVSSMTMAVHAAAPCPVDVKRQMIAWWGEIVHEYYSGTENNGFTALGTAEWLEHPGSVGLPKLGTLHICGEDGEELPAGAEGEIYFENGHQFAYHNDPAKTAECTNARGWTTLGDIGRVDEDGYLYLTARKSFLIISGGVNIYPQETEDVLLSHPLVLDAAVFGAPNADFGEEVKAVVQLVPSAVVSPALEAQLIAHCRARLSVIKCQRSVEFRADLPRSPTGKLYKRKLRDEYWARNSSA